MPMTPLYTRLGRLAFDETRMLDVRSHPTLPLGKYGFLELYCDELDCDCRRVIIQVFREDFSRQTWATIAYGWEDVSFYHRSWVSEEDAWRFKGPSLDPLNTQTEHSSALLELFQDLIRNPDYVERLKRHYSLFKDAILKEKESRRKPRKRGRR
ncbi:MAG: hypothetical protein NTW86_30750 [Candidatus Sumerlaeota bacterium]|nr:hypothetical protein [Candidatus Sumerlaeota bacterium]